MITKDRKLTLFSSEGHTSKVLPLYVASMGSLHRVTKITTSDEAYNKCWLSGDDVVVADVGDFSFFANPYSSKGCKRGGHHMTSHKIDDSKLTLYADNFIRITHLCTSVEEANSVCAEQEGISVLADIGGLVFLADKNDLGS